MRGSKMTRAVRRHRFWRVTYNGENRPVLWEQSNNSSSVDLAEEDQTISNQTIKQFFIWDPTEPIATRPLTWHNSALDTPHSALYYTHDGNKNVSEVIAANCDFAAHYDYAPFGAGIAQRGTFAAANPWRFSSEFADDELGCDYYNYREYEPVIGRWMSRDSLYESGGLNLFVACGNNLLDRYDVNGQFNPFSLWYDMLQFGLGAYAGLTVRNWFNDVKNKYKCCCNGKVVGLDEYDGVLDGTMTSWTIAHRVTGCKLKQLGVDLEHVLLLNLGHETMELLGFRPGLESEFISFLNKTSGNLEQALREYIGDTAKDVLAVLEGYFSDGKDCESKYIPKGCVYRADI